MGETSPKNKKEIDIFPPINIDSLPIEVLYDVLEHVDFNDIQTMRKCTHRMRDVCDGYVMKTFQKSLDTMNQDYPSSMEAAALVALDVGTFVYRHCGFYNTVANCFAHMMHGEKKPFAPDFIRIKKYLLTMYRFIDSTYRLEDYQKHDALYILTFIRLLKFFQTVKINIEDKSTEMFHQQIIEIEVAGPWFGVLWVDERNARVCIKDRYQFLVVMCELITGVIGKESFKRVWQCKDICYVYGIRVQSDLLPKFNVNFNMHGLQKVCALFNSAIMKEDFHTDNFVWPEEWTNFAEFCVQLNITSKEVAKWGCSPTQLLEFHPNFDEIEEDEPMNDISLNDSNALHANAKGVGIDTEHNQ